MDLKFCGTLLQCVPNVRIFTPAEIIRVSCLLKALIPFYHNFLVGEISSEELKIVVCEFVVEILVAVLFFYVR